MAPTAPIQDMAYPPRGMICAVDVLYSVSCTGVVLALMHHYPVGYTPVCTTRFLHGRGGYGREVCLHLDMELKARSSLLHRQPLADRHDAQPIVVGLAW